MGSNQKDMIIPTILEQLNSGKVVLKDIEPKRDYIYVSDVISAIISAFQSNIDGYKVFNLGSGKSHSVRELAEIIFNISGKKVSIVNLKQRRPNEIMDCIADITKAKNILGWEPKVSLAEGLAKIVL